MFHGRRRFLGVLAAVAVGGVWWGCSGSGSKPPAGIKAVGNAVCPVSGKAVGGSAKAPTFHSDFRGHRVGFMCPSCKGEFDSASDDKKLLLLNKALASVKRPPVK